MIPFEDWKAIHIPGFRSMHKPRSFKWKFKKFKKHMKGKHLKRVEDITSDDKLVIYEMEQIHGGYYWPIVGGGLIALPYDSKKFDFNEWVTKDLEMNKYIAIIETNEGCDYVPGCGTYFQTVKAKSFEEAWDKLIKREWSDFDPRFGGVEDPRCNVVNADWNPILNIRMIRVAEEQDSTYFDNWYRDVCANYEKLENEENEEQERAEYERLKKKYK